ncbi:MAG: efflux RND transporter periplasmic adaptor subunit [Crocinitomicaceae bacterium]
MRKIILFGSLAVLLFNTSCGSHKEEEVEATKFLVSNPIKMDTTITRDYVCQIHSISHIELRAQERGYLEKIFVDEGQFVKKGQLLFQIMPNLYSAEVAKQKAEANFAEIEYQNTTTLADKNVVSRNEQAMAKAKFEKAKAELALAQVHLQFTEIRAPFDGYIDRFYVRLGSLVDEGDLLTYLSDNSQMWVYYNVPEAEYLNYKLNFDEGKQLKVDLLMANNEIFNQTGIVETIEADFNNETGNIAFRATFQNPKKLLRHGETGNILMSSKLKNALIIPQKATYEVLEKKYVFIVDKQNVAHAREITIASEIPDLYIIKSGIKETDRIVVEGIRKIQDHQKIDFSYKGPKEIMKTLQVYVE